MTAKTDWLENAVLKHFLCNDIQSPISPYVALFINGAPPGEAGGGTEVSGPVGTTGYERKAVTFGTPTTGVVRNTNIPEFGPAITAWGTIGHFAIFDAASGGNMLYYADLISTKTVSIDDVLSFPVNAIEVAEY